jgi:phospholipase/carboxylesterase
MREAAGVQYLEIVTARADPASELPLVMAIHGLGDRPENFAPVLADLDEPARLIVPRALSAYHGGFSWFPFRGELRDEAVEKGVVAAAQALAKALDALQKTRPTRGRPIVTGFSQGGALSFALAVLHPTSVAAAIPVGGWVAFPLPLPKAAAGAPRPPITALHGAADSLIPVSPTRASVTSLRALGFQAELREFPGVGHSIPEPMRRELLGLVGAAVRAQAAQK